MRKIFSPFRPKKRTYQRKKILSNIRKYFRQSSKNKKEWISSTSWKKFQHILDILRFNVSKFIQISKDWLNIFKQLSNSEWSQLSGKINTDDSKLYSWIEKIPKFFVREQHLWGKRIWAPRKKTGHGRISQNLFEEAFFFLKMNRPEWKNPRGERFFFSQYFFEWKNQKNIFVIFVFLRVKKPFFWKKLF